MTLISLLLISADAPVMAHLFEYAFGEDLSLGYTDEGACKGTVGATYASPTRLKWELSEEVRVH